MHIGTAVMIICSVAYRRLLWRLVVRLLRLESNLFVSSVFVIDDINTRHFYGLLFVLFDHVG